MYKRQGEWWEAFAAEALLWALTCRGDFYPHDSWQAAYRKTVARQDMETSDDEHCAWVREAISELQLTGGAVQFGEVQEYLKANKKRLKTRELKAALRAEGFEEQGRVSGEWAGPQAGRKDRKRGIWTFRDPNGWAEYQENL